MSSVDQGSSNSCYGGTPDLIQLMDKGRQEASHLCYRGAANLIHCTATNMLINGGEKLGLLYAADQENNSVYQSHIQLEGQKL
jgi:hypothetical protein